MCRGFRLKGAFAIFDKLVPIAFKIKRRGPTGTVEPSRVESDTTLDKEAMWPSTMAPALAPNEKLTVAYV